MSIELTAFIEVAKQRYRVSPTFGFVSSDGEVRYFFRSLKDYRYSSDHMKSFDYLKVLKKDKHLSVDLKMNRLSATILSLSCCISFFELGCFMLMIAFI